MTSEEAERRRCEACRAMSSPGPGSRHGGDAVVGSDQLTLFDLSDSWPSPVADLPRTVRRREKAAPASGLLPLPRGDVAISPLRRVLSPDGVAWPLHVPPTDDRGGHRTVPAHVPRRRRTRPLQPDRRSRPRRHRRPRGAHPPPHHRRAADGRRPSAGLPSRPSRPAPTSRTSPRWPAATSGTCCRPASSAVRRHRARPRRGPGGPALARQRRPAADRRDQDRQPARAEPGAHHRTGHPLPRLRNAALAGPVHRRPAAVPG